MLVFFNKLCSITEVMHYAARVANKPFYGLEMCGAKRSGVWVNVYVAKCVADVMRHVALRAIFRLPECDLVFFAAFSTVRRIHPRDSGMFSADFSTV